MIREFMSAGAAERLFVVGLSYRTAPVELRERLMQAARDVEVGGRQILVQGGLREGVLLATCNRVERYGVPAHAGQMAPDPAEIPDRVVAGVPAAATCLYQNWGVGAVRPLFSVASGLDSMVLGETEITGQVKEAYEAARATGVTGPAGGRSRGSLRGAGARLGRSGHRPELDRLPAYDSGCADRRASDESATPAAGLPASCWRFLCPSIWKFIRQYHQGT